MIYLISYDLDHHARPELYSLVEKTIKENAQSWAKPLYSQWFVETDETVSDWQNRMKSVADEANDFWLIMPVKTPYEGWLSPEIWNWLNERA